MSGERWSYRLSTARACNPYNLIRPQVTLAAGAILGDRTYVAHRLLECPVLTRA